MKWPQFKEVVLRSMAVSAMELLYWVVKANNLVSKEQIHIQCYKVNGKNYHVRFFVANDAFGNPLFLVRPKGFLKEWFVMEKKDIPKCLADSIYGSDCTDSERKRLIRKVVDLKAFW